MSSFIINGGNKLNGKIIPSGAKNAALKMIAAACLSQDTITINNVPKIKDVLSMLDILISMGAKIEFKDSNLSINCSQINPENIDQNIVGNLRGSIVFIGPLLARFGKLRIHEPGGCVIGARSISTHINAIKKFGVNIKKEGKYYIFESHRLKGSRILLDEISVTATENILMAATLAKGTTEIHLAAIEPEIANLIDLLKLMGAKISGENTNILIVEGVDRLNSAQATVIPDRIEVGTLAIAAILTKGEITIKKIIRDHLDNLINKFDQMNVSYYFNEEYKEEMFSFSDLTITSTEIIKPINFDTRPYPGFSTDLQSPMVLLLTQANGKSKIFETLFEGRLEYTKILNEMGASIKTTTNRTIVIDGPSKLNCKEIISPDLRAGATFVLAGLIATGQTIVKNAEIIDRGYENFEIKLHKLGADIKRVDV